MPLSLQRMITCPDYRTFLQQANIILCALVSDDLCDYIISALKECKKREIKEDITQHQLAMECYNSQNIRNLIDSSLLFSTGYKDTMNLQATSEEGVSPSGSQDTVDVEIHIRKNKDNIAVNTSIKVETPLEIPVFQVCSKLPSTMLEGPISADEFEINQEVIPPITIPCEKPLDRPCLHNKGEWRIPQVVLIDYAEDEDDIVTNNMSDSMIMPTFFENSEDVKNFKHKYPAHRIIRNRTYQMHKPRISPNALMPNETRTHEPVSFHSKETCTASFSSNEERGIEDFLPIIEHECCEKDGGSLNNPMVFRIHMNGYKLQKIEGMSSEEYQHHESKHRCQNTCLLINNQNHDKENTRNCLLTPKMNGSAREILIDNVVYKDLKEENDDSSIDCEPILDRTKYTFVDGSFKLKSYQIGDYTTFEANRPKIPFDANEQTQALTFATDDTIFEVKPQVEFIADLFESRCHMLQNNDVKRKTLIDSILNSEQKEQALDQILEIWLQNIERDYIREENNLYGENIWKMVDLTIQATRQAKFDMLETFLDDHGVDVNTVDEFGNTLLLLAAQQGNKKLCKFLLRRGAHMNAKNFTGNTVLHFLHKFGHLDLADYMRHKGADDSFVNDEGLTCYEMANHPSLYSSSSIY